MKITCNEEPSAINIGRLCISKTYILHFKHGARTKESRVVQLNAESVNAYTYTCAPLYSDRLSLNLIFLAIDSLHKKIEVEFLEAKLK